jgi:hypothetical protein
MEKREMQIKIQGKNFIPKLFYAGYCPICGKEEPGIYLDKNIEICEPCFNELQKSNYINSDEKFWNHSYRIHLHELDSPGILVNANCEQDALDYVIDWHEEKGNMGLFFTNEELDAMTEEERGEYITGGNHCLTCNSYNVRIIEID